MKIAVKMTFGNSPLIGGYNFTKVLLTDVVKSSIVHLLSLYVHDKLTSEAI